MATTRTSSPSDLVTRLSQRCRRMPHMSCSFRDVFSFRFFHASSHITLHRAQMSHVQKNKRPETMDWLTLKHRNPMILPVFKCRNSSLDHYDTVRKFIEKLMEQSFTTKLFDECQKKQFDNNEHWSVDTKKEFVNAPHWSIAKWISKLAKGGGQKKRFQYCLNPNYPQKILYLRAIQGHSGKHYQFLIEDNVLLPEGFTEYFYHVGNWKELMSIVNHGLIPWGVSLKTGRHAVFFTVNPMDNQDGLGETMCDLSQPRIAPYKNTWKHLQDTVFWCNLKLAQDKGLLFYQTRSHAVVLYNTVPAACMEKAVWMKTQEELYQKVRLTPRMPRVVLKSNLQRVLQDLRSPDAISSWDPPSDSKSYGETWNNTVHYRIPGIPLSTGYNTWKQGQKVDREVREPQT